MPERREGINPQRAAQLEEILEGQFEIAGLGKAGVHEGLTAIEIIDRGMRENVFGTLADALDHYFQARAVDGQLRVQIALICGELFSAGDLSSVVARLERSEKRIGKLSSAQ